MINDDNKAFSVKCDICNEEIEPGEDFIRIDNGLTVCSHCYYIDSIYKSEEEEEY